MSLFFLLNPKCFIDAGWIEKHLDPFKKRKPEIEKATEVAIQALPGGRESQKSKELESKINNFIGFSQKISKIEENLENILLELKEQQRLHAEADALELEQIKLAQQILEMDEEEQFILLLLL